MVTQVELAEMLDDWEGQASLGRMPVREVVMVQCAGSRDKRHLPHCSRLCCMIALKHAIRLRTLFPEMKVTICYLEMRTAGVGYENWFLAARQAGVEFLRGTPPEVQFDRDGRPVIEVEDVTAARKRVLRPDLVVLSTGMVPATDTEHIAETLGIERDEDGFIEILDRKNRATETSSEGMFVCGSASGPKALIEVNTEAAAVASEIHNFLSSAGRRGTPASQVDAAQCVGCDTCMTMCPFGAITLVDRPADAARPAEVKDDGKLAVIDQESCRACGICAANCPEVAIAHNLGDDALFGRIALMTRGRGQAGHRLLLQGVRRRRHRPERPASRQVPGERAADRAALPGQSQRPAHRRGGPPGRGRRVPRRLRRRPLSVPQSATRAPSSSCSIAEELLADGGTPLPVELWHLCAVDRLSVGRRIRLFHARAVGDELSLEELEREMELDRRRSRRPGGRRSPAPSAKEVRAVAVAADTVYPQSVVDEFKRLAEECCTCYQCGTCTSSCPSGRELYRGPRRLVRLILAGEIDAVLKSDDLWRCTGCGTCTEVCRMDIDVAAVLGRPARLEREHGTAIRCPERSAADIAAARLRQAAAHRQRAASASR